MPWHWSAIPGHLLCLTSCHADHPSLSKENSLCCPARHILTNLAWDLGENPKSLGDNISLPHTKYLRSLRASSDLARREEREVGFPGWISELIPGGKNPLMRTAVGKLCTNKAPADTATRVLSVSLVCLSAEERCDIWMWMAGACWLKTLMNHLWAAAPAACRLSAELLKSEEGKVDSEASPRHCRGDCGGGNGCSNQPRGIRFISSPRSLGFLSFLLLLVTELMKHPRKTTRQPLADVSLSDLGFGLEWWRPGWPWNTNQEHVSFGKN